MSGYTTRFENRRSGKERRDWDEFVLHNRRDGNERRAGKERRRTQKPFPEDDRRKRKTEEEQSTSQGRRHKRVPHYYTTREAAERTGISLGTLLLWIRNKVLDDARIHRDRFGRRAFTEADIDRIFAIKKSEGWE